MKRIAVYFATAVVCALGATAETVIEPLGIEPGAVFIFNDGRVERFVEERGEEQVWATRNGREFLRSENFTIPILEWNIGAVKGTRTVSGRPEAIWPPSEGARSRFRVATDVTRDGEKTRRSIQFWSCSAGRYETQSLPFGEADVLPVVCDRFSPSSMTLLERRSWLWAPDVGHFVERSFQEFDTGNRETIRLCAKLPGRTATEQRIDSVIEQGC